MKSIEESMPVAKASHGTLDITLSASSISLFNTNSEDGRYRAGSFLELKGGDGRENAETVLY